MHGSNSFFTPHARDLIGRLLRKFLDDVRITPTELLHSVTYQRKLNNSGNFLESAVQKASIAQVKDTTTNVAVRIKEMHALLESVSKRVHAQEQGYGIEKMNAKECWAELAKTAAGPDSDAKDFQMYRLLTRYMEPSHGWRDKFKRLLKVFELLSSGDSGKNPRNVAFVDTLLGEIIRSKAGLDMVIGDFETLEERLNDIAALYLGEFEPEEKGPIGIETAGEIASLFRNHKLTSSRTGLTYHVYNALAGRMNILSRDVIVELTAIARLNRRPQNRARDYRRCKDLRSPRAPRRADSKRPADLLSIFSGSALSELQKKKYSDQSVQLQDEFINAQNFFGSLDEASQDPSKKAIFLMKLCAEGAFIEGPNLDTARKLAGRYVLQPEFLPTYLADAKTGEERLKRVDRLKRYLLDAGIDETLGAT